MLFEFYAATSTEEGMFQEVQKKVREIVDEFFIFRRERGQCRSEKFSHFVFLVNKSNIFFLYPHQAAQSSTFLRKNCIAGPLVGT